MIRIAFLIVVLTALVDAVDADDWPCWRGPNANGVSSENNWDHNRLHDQNAVSWRQDVGIGFCGVVTQGKLLYTIGNQDDVDTIRCLDAGTGELVWKFSYASPLDDRDFPGGPTSTPTIDGPRLFTLSRGGDLYCFQALSGEVLWQQQIVDLADVRIPGWGFSASPLVIGNTLLLNAGDAGVALDKMTGELIWKSGDKDCGYGSPVLMKLGTGSTAIIPSGRSYVAVDIRTGQERWRHRWLTTFGCNAADPIVDANRVFLSSGYNRGAALLEIRNGQVNVLWKNKLMQNQISASIMIDGNLYGVDGDIEQGARLTCMSMESGDVQWSNRDLKAGAIAATNDRLIVITADGELVVAKAQSEKYEELARKKVLDGKCWTAPVLSHGRIYCRSASGDLVCINVTP